jgi:hypothetical protein
MRLSRVSTAISIFLLGGTAALTGCGDDDASGPAPFEATSNSSSERDDRESSTLEADATNELPGSASGGAPAGEEDDALPPSGASSTLEQPTATVRLDNVEMMVGDITLWAPNAEGEALVFIKFQGPGAPAGTDLVVSFTKTGKGCVASPKPKAQDVWLRPPTTADQFHSADGAGCGLEITSFPATAGSFATGAFRGTVSGINGATGKTRSLDVLFRVPRKK